MMALPYLRFQVNGQGWPVINGLLIPTGTVVDYAVRDTWGMLCWNAQLIPPYDVTPLDMTTYNFLQQQYPFHDRYMGGPPT
jgi:hypothetical protein